MIRQLALLIGRHAARVVEPIRPAQAAAMYAEIETLNDREGLAWALGCLAAAYRQRASVMAIAVVSARLCVAAAAGAFGLLHVTAATTNMWLKLALTYGQAPEWATPGFVAAIESQSLMHWLASFVMLSLLGMFHVMAALMMATGRNDRVRQLAIILVGLDVLMPLLGVGPVIMAMIYVFLITLMAAASSCLAWMWRWDERRIAQC